MRYYGKLVYDEPCDEWIMAAEPHVIMRAKRVFGKANVRAGGLRLLATDENSRELEWFLERYPLEVEDPELLSHRSGAYTERVLTMDRILGGEYEPRAFEMALPPREYQKIAAELCMQRGFLIVGDDVGLGKTVTALTMIADAVARPAVVVTLAHLPRQWEAEVHRFLPDLHVHVLKKGTPYELPKFFGRGPDVIITNYHKLAGWSSVLATYAKSIVFDEIQELRRQGSQKYDAAQHISRACDYRMGLSATPIYNYGDEFFSVADVLEAGCLGSNAEFLREWCGWSGGQITDPKAFGTYVREQHIMLRRTRKDVGREIPEVMIIPHEIEADAEALLSIEGDAIELAKIIMRKFEATREERFNAAGQFEAIMRQATGIAKAPYVAKFVQMLVESGESVVLYGWHREVYTIWQRELAEFSPVLYTGTESAAAKDRNATMFCSGKSKVLMMSLRAGAGLEGLQHVSRTVVFGELDWAAGVHEQCIGRVARDGQEDSVAAYYMISDHGCDPIMVDVLGIKKQQVEGIRNPDGELIEKLQNSGAHVKALAQSFLKGR